MEEGRDGGKKRERERERERQRQRDRERASSANLQISRYADKCIHTCMHKDICIHT